MREKDVLDEVISPKALFVIACVILVISIVTFTLSMVYLQDMTAPAPEMGEPSESEPGLPGGEIIGAFLMIFVSIVMVTLIMLFHAFLWGAGMLVSARLAFSGQEKPKWMQICAWILTAIFTTLVAVSLGFVAYVVLMLFVW